MKVGTELLRGRSTVKLRAASNRDMAGDMEYHRLRAEVED
jgi:hypothetical protein